MKKNTHSSTFQQEIEAIARSVQEELIRANETNTHDLKKAIREDPYKLFYFSVRVINAIANSFMGVPAAAIIIAADRILAGTLAATLSTPDKIFILLLASAILMTFLTLAYKSEASTNRRQELSISIAQLVDMARVLSLPDKTITQAKDEARCEKMIIAIRQGKLREDIPDGESSEINTLFTDDPILKILINNEVILRPEAFKNPDRYPILYRALYLPNYQLPDHLTEDSAVSKYINVYKQLASITDDPKRWELIKIKFQHLLEKLTIEDKYQKRFSTIGSTLGNVNALVNGILTCSFGIGGLTAFLVIFAPGFTIPLAAAIPVALILFIAGTIHSGTTTKAFIKDSFTKFGVAIDKEHLCYPEHTFYDWLGFASKNIRDNKKSLLIAAVASATVTGLCVLATHLFFSSLPLITPVVMTIVITVALLTWVSAFNSFNSVLMRKAQSDKDKQWYIEHVLSDEERNTLNTAKQVKTFHAAVACIITAGMLAITIPLMSTQLGLLMPLMISFGVGMISYLATALFNSSAITKAQEPNEKNPLQIFNYRFRIMIAIILGSSFALTAGPVLASALINILPMVGSAATIPLAVTFGMVVAASLYYVMPLVYWDIALKPSYAIALTDRKLTPEDSPKQENSSPTIAQAPSAMNTTSNSSQHPTLFSPGNTTGKNTTGKEGQQPMKTENERPDPHSS